jgi:hypothetical protein
VLALARVRACVHRRSPATSAGPAHLCKYLAKTGVGVEVDKLAEEQLVLVELVRLYLLGQTWTLRVGADHSNAVPDRGCHTPKLKPNPNDAESSVSVSVAGRGVPRGAVSYLPPMPSSMYVVSRRKENCCKLGVS